MNRHFLILGGAVRGHFSSALLKGRAAVAAQRCNVESAIALIGVNVVIAAVGFITRIRIANLVGNSDFGLFAYGLAIAAYGEAIIRFGQDRTLVRDLIHDPDKRAQLIVSSFVLRATLLGIVVGGLLFWKAVSWNMAASDLTWGVVLVALGRSLLGMEPREVYDSLGEFKRHAVYTFLQRFLYFGAIWVMVLLAPASVSVFWIGVFTLLSVVLFLFVQVAWIKRHIDFRDATQGWFRNTFKLGKSNVVIWLSCLACLSFGMGNQILLKLLAGKESLGNYAAAWTLVSVSVLCLGQIARIGRPACARFAKPTVSAGVRARFLARYTTIMVLVSLPVCCACIVFPDTIIGLLFRAEYSTASTPLRILGFYLLVFPIGLVFSQYIISVRMNGVYFWVTLLSGFGSIVASVLLIPPLGGVGAAYALLIPKAVSIVVFGAVSVGHVAFLARDSKAPSADSNTAVAENT